MPTRRNSEIFFKLFWTTSSEVLNKKFFNNRFTAYIPDFFFVFFYASILQFSALVDRVLIIILFIADNYPLLTLWLWITSWAPLFYVFILNPTGEEFLPEYSQLKWCMIIFQVIIVLFGIDSTVLGRKILHNTFKRTRNSIDLIPSDSFPVFNTKNSDLCLIKIHCCINSILKSIPQLLIISMLVMKDDLTGISANVAFISIILNMVIFSLTMAIAFPMRKHPRIFTSWTCMVLDSFSKFMATFCSCGVSVVVFTMLFMKNGFIGLGIYVVRFIWTLHPCYYFLSSKPKSLPIKLLIVQGVFLSFIFSFVYIHPFEGKGIFFYYYLYLINFLTDLASIYIFTDADYNCVSIFLTLRFLSIGFLTTFSTVNTLHKVKKAIPITPYESFLLTPPQKPSQNPSQIPTPNTSRKPSQNPSQNLLLNTSTKPSQNPSHIPTPNTSQKPSQNPSQIPPLNTSRKLSQNPQNPTLNTSRKPSQNPPLNTLRKPSQNPSQNPLLNTLQKPSQTSQNPQLNTLQKPSENPSQNPSSNPSRGPSQPHLSTSIPPPPDIHKNDENKK